MGVGLVQEGITEFKIFTHIYISLIESCQTHNTQIYVNNVKRVKQMHGDNYLVLM